MCLSVAVDRPQHVLGSGIHEGFEWMVVQNGCGYRCGYVKVLPGHPWHGKGYDEIDPSCHGGLTFAHADTECGKGGQDNGWWLGFDCAHSQDEPDPGLDGSVSCRVMYGDMDVAYDFVESLLGTDLPSDSAIRFGHPNAGICRIRMPIIVQSGKIGDDHNSVLIHAARSAVRPILNHGRGNRRRGSHASWRTTTTGIVRVSLRIRSCQITRSDPSRTGHNSTTGRPKIARNAARVSITKP